MSENRVNSYVAIHPKCGLIDSAVVIDETRLEFAAKTIAGWARRKVPPEIRQMPTEEVRTASWCNCARERRAS